MTYKILDNTAESDNTLLSKNNDENIKMLDELSDSSESDNEGDNVTMWNNYSYIKPLKILSQISGYPNLLVLYTIFSCLAVSSTSAERALSKLKIIKNRLRSTIADDYLSALMTLASEKDLLNKLPDEDVILRVAMTSPLLKAELLYY